ALGRSTFYAQDRSASRQEARRMQEEVLLVVLMRRDVRCGPATRLDSLQRAAIGGEHDGAIGTPCTRAPETDRGDDGGIRAVEPHALEARAGRERDRRTVRREEERVGRHI